VLITRSFYANSATSCERSDAVGYYLFFVAHGTSPFLTGVFEAIFGAEKGWKQNKTNRRILWLYRGCS